MSDETMTPEEVSGDNLPAQTGVKDVANTQQRADLLTVHHMEDGVPDLYDTEQYEAVPVDMASDYWNPQAEGETKRLLFDRVERSMVPDIFGPSKGVNGETVELETAFFFEMKKGTKEVSVVRQASRSLLMTLNQLGAQHGTLFEIVYKGLVKFQRTGFTGQSWGVYPVRKLEKKPAAS